MLEIYNSTKFFLTKGRVPKKNQLWKIPYWEGVSEGHFPYPIF